MKVGQSRFFLRHSIAMWQRRNHFYAEWKSSRYVPWKAATITNWIFMLHSSIVTKAGASIMMTRFLLYSRKQLKIQSWLIDGIIHRCESIPPAVDAVRTSIWQGVPRRKFECCLDAGDKNTLLTNSEETIWNLRLYTTTTATNDYGLI